MQRSELLLLQYFSNAEKDYAGNPVKWEEYHFGTMKELDRLRHEIGSPCKLIRGSHGYLKETAIDAVFPQANYGMVVMALMRSGLSKGVYEGGSIHLDMRMGASGLARCWMGFKPERDKDLAKFGWSKLKAYEAHGWSYYSWGTEDSWDVLTYLVDLNQPQTPSAPTQV